MRIWQRAFKLASTLLLSVGFAAAQTPQTTPTRQDQAPETGGIPVTRPVEGEPAPGTKPMEEEILVTGSRLRRKDLTTTAPVERIEILKDGASAVYGSDAIAGVVNIITRRRFNGTELSGEYGISTRGDAETIDVQGVMGRTGDWGNFLVAAGYFTQGESWLRDRDFSKFAYTYDYSVPEQQPGGSSRTPQGVIQMRRRTVGGMPVPDPNCTPGTLCRRLFDAYPNSWFNRFVRDPNGDPSIGVNLGWRPFVGADRYNFASENYLTIPSERIQAYASADTKVGIARPYFEASLVQRHTQQNAAPMPLNPGDYNFPGTNRALFVSKDSVYNPFGVDLTFAGRRLVEFGRR